MKLRDFLKIREVRLFLAVWIIYLLYLTEIGGAYSISAAALTVSIADEHSLSLDTYKGHDDAHNFAFYKGKFYSGVAPGASFIALPFYAIFKPIIHAAINMFPLTGYPTPMINLGIALFVSVIITSFASALTSVLLYRILRHFIASEPKRLFLTFAFSFGTLFFIYSTRYEPILISTFFSFLAFYILFRIKNDNNKNPGNMLFFSGLAASIAITVHYLNFVIWIFLGLYLFSFSKNYKHWLIFLSGSIMPLILLLLYHYYLFDSPFKTGYHYLYRFTGGDATKVEIPSLIKLWWLSFSPYKGFFFYMPVMLLSFASLYYALASKFKYRFEALYSLALFAVYFLFAVSIEWVHSCNFGPKYLIPVIPFMFINIGSIIERLHFAWIAVPSIIYIFINYLSALYGRYCTGYNDIFNVYIPLLFDKGLAGYKPLNLISEYFFNVTSYFIIFSHLLVILLAAGLILFACKKKI